MFLMQIHREDQIHVEAAEGWFELGNILEASEELEKITPENRAHPEVLELRCRIYQSAGKFEYSLAVSKTLCDQLPKRLNGWLHQARCLHHLGRTHQAYHLLVDVVELFPGNQTIRYDIACYAAQRGLIEEAREWLKLCFENDTDGEYRKRALDEPLLKKVWQQTV